MKIELFGADNARDFTGIKNSKGKTIVSKSFIRSNLLNSINEQDVKILKDEYQLKKVIDLRTGVEIAERPNVIIEGVKYFHIPLINESAIGLTHEESTDKSILEGKDLLDLNKLYVRLVSDEYSIQQLAKVMRILVDTILIDEGAVLWHCTEGKDRCGIVSVMFLSMLDVDKESIIKDYLETNKVAVKRADAFYETVLEKSKNIFLANKAKKAFLANEDYLNAALFCISESYSSIQEYISNALKISMEEMQQVRDKCLA